MKTPPPIMEGVYGGMINPGDKREFLPGTQGAISLEDIYKLDDKFQRQIRAHPEDAETLIRAHLIMVLVLSNHAIPKSTNFFEWTNTWYIPYSRIEHPSPQIISDIASDIRTMIYQLSEESFVHYSFLERLPENNNAVMDSVTHIIWNFVFEEFFNFVKKTYSYKDQNLSYKLQSLSQTPLSQFKIPRDFYLENLSTPYLPAITTLQQLPHQKSVDAKLKCISLTATKICTCVAQYWTAPPPPQGGGEYKDRVGKDLSVGGDELLPLMAYVIIKAKIPALFSECAFMELFIDNQRAIEQEGYVLATFQSALSLIEHFNEPERIFL